MRSFGGRGLADRDTLVARLGEAPQPAPLNRPSTLQLLLPERNVTVCAICVGCSGLLYS